MTLRVVGAGLGRTGTNSLKVGLEQLLGGPCYHMLELMPRVDEHLPLWHAAVRNEAVDWDLIFGDYVAAVDWPACAFYDVLMNRYPDAVVVLSTRRDGEAWWESFSATILQVMLRLREEPSPWFEMVSDMFDTRFTPNWDDKVQGVAAYERHNELVRRLVPADRLVEWQASDGWGPLCRALGLAEPAEPFPHVNTTDEFRAMTGLDAAAAAAAEAAPS